MDAPTPAAAEQQQREPPDARAAHEAAKAAKTRINDAMRRGRRLQF